MRLDDRNQTVTLRWKETYFLFPALTGLARLGGPDALVVGDLWPSHGEPKILCRALQSRGSRAMRRTSTILSEVGHARAAPRRAKLKVSALAGITSERSRGIEATIPGDGTGRHSSGSQRSSG